MASRTHEQTKRRLFIKVDCGKLTDASEVFGMPGAYQGAEQGSALNNFVLSMSMEPNAVGIVLLDEIEKANQGVIHALYQVIDKNEWTNKRLGSNVDDELTEHLSLKVRSKLQFSYPFTEAFIGRIGRIVPFLPMASGTPEIDGIMHGECMTVAKWLIERQKEKFATSSFADIKQLISARTKHQMSKIIVKEAIKEAGVRAIQVAVEQKMGDRILDSVLLEKNGIEDGSHVRYYTREEAESIDFRVEDLSQVDNDTEQEETFVDDADLFG